MLIKSNVEKGGYFFEYIRQRIKHNKNFMASIVGQTGSGKSYATLRAMELLMNKPYHLIVKNVCFTALEFMDRLNSGELEKGDVLIWDEVGISLSSKEWQSVSNKLVNYTLQTFRHLNLITIFTTPHFSFIDASSRRLFHSVWETMGINYRNNTCEIKPLLLQVNPRSGDLYFKYLRVNDKDYGLMPIKRILFSLPSKELIEAYEKKKKAFTSNLSKDIYDELKEVKRKSKRELTLHQKKILDYVNKGYTIKEICNELGVSDTAVKQSVGAIRRKGVIVDFQRKKHKKLRESKAK